MLFILHSLPTSTLSCLSRLGWVAAIARFGQAWNSFRIFGNSEGSTSAPKSTHPAIYLIRHLLFIAVGVIPGLSNRDQFTFLTQSGRFRLDPDPT